MALPQNNRLPISYLTGIFSNTTATYKYYWFVAITIFFKINKAKLHLF